MGIIPGDESYSVRLNLSKRIVNEKSLNRKKKKKKKKEKVRKESHERMKRKTE
jgi:hypothetical protein